MSAWLRWRHGRRAAATPLAPLYAQPAPAPRQRVQDSEFLALDLETTGLDPARDRILSLGWVLLRGDVILLRESGHQIVRDVGAEVGASATIHGIVDADLEGALPLADALAGLWVRLAGRALLAHCASIECGFLAAACRRLYGLPPPLQAVDTLAIEASLRANAHETPGALRLEACRARHRLPRYRAHNAASDALACAELLLAQVRALGAPQLSMAELYRRSG